MKHIVNVDGKLYTEEAGSSVICQDGCLYAQDDRWITVNGEDNEGKGQHVLIKEDGTVVGGLGGKLNGMKLSKVKGLQPEARPVNTQTTGKPNKEKNGVKPRNGTAKRAPQFVLSKEQADALKSKDEFAKGQSQGLENDGVDYNPVVAFDKQPSDRTIIKNLGGPDRTGGSCASVGLCYVAQKNGMNVLDFRGGRSQRFFASVGHLEEIIGSENLAGSVREHDDFKAAHGLLKILDNYPPNKEFLLMVGKHAAIVRKTKSGQYQYLELQSGIYNGWCSLKERSLERRFGCQQSHTIAGAKIRKDSYLADCDKFKNSDRFKYFLGYLNTAKSEQQKGVGGSIK